MAERNGDRSSLQEGLKARLPVNAENDTRPAMKVGRAETNINRHVEYGAGRMLVHGYLCKHLRKWFKIVIRPMLELVVVSFGANKKRGRNMDSCTSAMKKETAQNPKSHRDILLAAIVDYKYLDRPFLRPTALLLRSYQARVFSSNFTCSAPATMLQSEPYVKCARTNKFAGFSPINTACRVPFTCTIICSAIVQAVLHLILN